MTLLNNTIIQIGYQRSKLSIKIPIFIYFKYKFQKLSCIAIEKDDLVEKQLSKDADVVDSSQNTTSEETEVIEVAVPYVHLNSSASLQKPKSFGKASSSMFESDKESEYSNNWIVDQNRCK